MMSLPLWGIALVLAAVAPLFARGLASALERWARERGKRILEAGRV